MYYIDAFKIKQFLKNKITTLNCIPLYILQSSFTYGNSKDARVGLYLLILILPIQKPRFVKARADQEIKQDINQHRT